MQFLAKRCCFIHKSSSSIVSQLRCFTTQVDNVDKFMTRFEKLLKEPVLITKDFFLGKLLANSIKLRNVYQILSPGTPSLLFETKDGKVFGRLEEKRGFFKLIIRQLFRRTRGFIVDMRDEENKTVLSFEK